MYRRWNEFQGVPNKFRNDKPHVTVNKKGVILLNSIAHEAFGAPDLVTLVFDKTNGVIGLKPAELGTPNAFPVKGKGGWNLVIHGMPFLRHNEIETDKTLTFNNVAADEGILVLDLATVTSVSKKKASGN
ncbi:MAG: hypothetical protein WKF92_12295 [Pyrinomonadaceae bacterium]